MKKILFAIVLLPSLLLAGPFNPGGGGGSGSGSSDGTGNWTASGNDSYQSTGKIGIGISNPGFDLQLASGSLAYFGGQVRLPYWNAINLNSVIPSTHTGSASMIQFVNSQAFTGQQIADGSGWNGTFFSMLGDNLWGNHTDLQGHDNLGFALGIHGNANTGILSVVDTSSGSILRAFIRPSTNEGGSRPMIDLIMNSTWEAYASSKSFAQAGTGFTGTVLRLSSTNATGTLLSVWDMDYRGVTRIFGPNGIGAFSIDMGRTLADKVTLQSPGFAFWSTGTTTANDYDFYSPAGNASGSLSVQNGVNGLTLSSASVTTHLRAAGTDGQTATIFHVSSGSVDLFRVNGTSIAAKLPLYMGGNGVFDASEMSLTGTGNGILSSTPLYVDSGLSRYIVAPSSITLNGWLLPGVTNYIPVAISSDVTGGFASRTEVLVQVPTGRTWTITKVIATSLPSGATVHFNIEERTAAGLGSAGTDVFTVVDATAAVGNANSTTGITGFANASIAADAYLVATTPATGSAGGPNRLIFQIWYLEQ